MREVTERDDIAARLGAVRSSIAAACARAGRDPGAVRLVGVSKIMTAEAVAEAIAAGLAIVGENRVQEAAGKRVACAFAAARPEWHLIGPLQSNKAKLALETFDAIHTLDGEKLAERLARLAEEGGRRCPWTLLEVNLAEEPSKHGVAPQRAGLVLERLARIAGIEVRGLMAIPPAGDSAEESRPYFRALARLAADLDRAGAYRTPLSELSMGMSADYEVAIEEGATLVRVGSAIFGSRILIP